MWVDAFRCSRPRGRFFQLVRSGCSVAIAQTKPASSRAQATTIFCCGLPRAAIRCQRQALDDHGVLAALAAGELVADLRPSPRVPGRLDEQAADVAVADLGDRALPALLAGGVLRGDEPDEGHELLGAVEAAEVADLGDERERGQRLDATQAAQARH